MTPTYVAPVRTALPRVPLAVALVAALGLGAFGCARGEDLLGDGFDAPGDAGADAADAAQEATAAPQSVCGDGKCAGSESCSTCPEDCDACPAGSENGICGDRTCGAGESQESCPIDCGPTKERCLECSPSFASTIGDNGSCTSNGHVFSRCVKGCSVHHFCVDINRSCRVENGVAACR
jgi:hypothetical protein